MFRDIYVVRTVFQSLSVFCLFLGHDYIISHRRVK
jgi:hypothetical protein